MTPTTKEPRITAAPCTLLISSRPVRDRRAVAWTTAAAAAAHAVALAVLIWATARSVPITPVDGVDMIVLELPEPGLSMPRALFPAAPGPRRADPPRRVAPAARPASPAAHRALPPPPRVLGSIPTPAPAAPALAEPKFAFEPARVPAPAPAPAPAAAPAAAARDDTPGPVTDAVKDDAPRAATDDAPAAAGDGAGGAGALGAAGAERPATVEELALGPPTFTPFTRAPELVNRAEITEYLRRRYPPGLQQMGIGGQCVLWILLDERGHIRKSLLLRSSGRESLDDAALEATDHMRFSPAVNLGKKVPVWIQLPVVFRVEN